MVGLDFNSEAYQTLSGQVESLSNEYDNLTESIDNWREAQRMVSINRLTENYEDWNRIVNNAVNNMSNRTSLGARLTSQDYDQRIAGYNESAT